MASVQERPDSPYLRVSYKNAEGKWVQEKTPFTKEQRAEAERLAEKLERLAQAVAVTADGSPSKTVNAWAEDWFAHRRGTVKSYVDDESRIRTHVLPSIGSYPITAVRQTDIQAIFDGLKTKKTTRGNKVLSSATARCVLTALKVMFSDAVTRGLIPSSPVMLMSGTMAKVRKTSTVPYSTTEIDKLLSAPESIVPADRKTFWALLAFCGLRIGEGAALRWSDLDDAQEPLGQLTIDKAYSVRRKVVDTTKTDVVRSVPVHPALAEILTAWRDRGFVEMFGRPSRPDDLIVPSRRGTERSSNHMLKKLKKDLEKAKVPHPEARKAHAFRTTFITELRSAGVDKEIVRAITHGLHASRDVIDLFYTKWKWSDLCGAVMRLPVTGKTPAENPPAETEGVRFPDFSGDSKSVFSLSKMAGWTGLEISRFVLGSANEAQETLGFCLSSSNERYRAPIAGQGVFPVDGERKTEAFPEPFPEPLPMSDVFEEVFDVSVAKCTSCARTVEVFLQGPMRCPVCDGPLVLEADTLDADAVDRLTTRHA